MLFLSGGAPRGLFVVVSGEIRVFQQNREGREQVMHVDTAGSVVAEVAVFDGGPYLASAISDGDAEVLFIDKHDMHQFFRTYPALALKALRLMAQRVREHAQLVEILSFHEVGERLARLLLTVLRDSGIPVSDGATFRLPFSNNEIAARIGTVRDVVSRALARLRHDGLIVAEDREVTVPNVQALRRYASSALDSGETKQGSAALI